MESEMLRCPKCRYEYEWTFQVDHHVRREHPEHSYFYAAELFHAIAEPEQFSCTCCGFSTYYNWVLYKHYKRQHHSMIDEKSFENNACNEEAPKNYRCNLCRCQSHSSLCLVKHTDSCRTMARTAKNPNETLTSKAIVRGKKRKALHCTECSYKSKQKDLLKEHILLRHPSVLNIDWFQCAKCSHKTKRISSLKTHMLTHATQDEIDWFHCPKCSYKVKRKTHLKRHMLTHASSEEIDWFQCTKCSYKAKRKSSLVSHMLTHASSAELYWFQCAKCSHRAKRKRDLERHMLTHASSEEIDWFQCEQCSYKAKQKSCLKQHMLTHASSEEINWFRCDQCSYKAKRKAVLQNHALTHE